MPGRCAQDVLDQAAQLTDRGDFKARQSFWMARCAFPICPPRGESNWSFSGTFSIA